MTAEGGQMSDDGSMRFLSDRSVLGHEVYDAAVRVSRRRMFSDLDRADRDDLVGTTIDKYYATWGQLGRPDNIEAWVSTVMRNAMMDLFRRRRMLRPVAGAGAGAGDDSVEELIEQWLPPAPSLSLPVVDRDAREAFLASLTPADARLLCLKAEGYTHQEIGDVLGVRANAVDVRLHRLRARLRTRFAAEDGDPHQVGLRQRRRRVVTKLGNTTRRQMHEAHERPDGPGGRSPARTGLRGRARRPVRVPATTRVPRRARDARGRTRALRTRRVERRHPDGALHRTGRRDRRRPDVGGVVGRRRAGFPRLAVRRRVRHR